MIYRITAERFVFSTASRFITDKVRICTAQACRTYCLVSINHNLVIGCLFNGIKIVIIHPLSVVVLTARNDIAYITALHSIVTVVYHELVSLVHMTFVVAYRSRSFMVHHQTNTLAGCILLKFFHVKVRVRSDKVEHIILALTEPIFPTFVPSFYQYLAKSVFCCKIDIAFYVSCISRVLAVRFNFRIIGYAQFNTIEFVCISPSAFVGNHIPPYSDVFHRSNP